MKSFKELQTQINGLVNKISQCNFIPFIEKSEIIQNTWVKIIEKMNEGVLVDDFEQIKGYTFFIVRNFCNRYHVTKHRISYIEDLPETFEQETIISTIDRSIYHQILLKCLNKKDKFSDIERSLANYILNDYTSKEIVKKLNFQRGDMGRIKNNLVNKLRYNVNPKVKYLIKNHNDSSISIPCYTKQDFLKHLDGKYQKQYMLDCWKKQIDFGSYYIVKL
jgi:hypothetical protein